jgi:nicotinate-nucleotide adenylyltransferase
MIGLLGGAFDPPHNGHIALARAALAQFGLEELVVLVAERPGHKQVSLPAETRLRLARAAFPKYTVSLDEHERTIDTLRAGRWRDPLFLIGADEFSDLLTWKDPEGVLERARLGVATRPGYPRERLDAVLERLSQPQRVLFFEIDPVAVSSRELRARLALGDSVDGLVPRAVAELIADLGLYRGYTAAQGKDSTNL